MERLYILVNKVLLRLGNIYNNIDKYIKDKELDYKCCNIDIFYLLSADNNYNYFYSSCIALIEEYYVLREKELVAREKEWERA